MNTEFENVEKEGRKEYVKKITGKSLSLLI